MAILLRRPHAEDHRHAWRDRCAGAGAVADDGVGCYLIKGIAKPIASLVVNHDIGDPEVGKHTTSLILTQPNQTR